MAPCCPRDHVEVVVLERLGQIEVDLSLVLGHQLLPSATLRALGDESFLVVIELGFFLADLVGHGKVGTKEAAVAGPLERVVLEPELEEGDLARLVVADQPVVGIAAVVAVEHDPDEVVDRPAVLERLPRTDELGLAGGVPALELSDRRLGDHDPGRVDAEIVVAGDHARQAVHDECASPVAGLMSKTIFQRVPTT